MKKYYTYGEIFLVLREEYRECKRLLDNLHMCVLVKDVDVKNYYFSGILKTPGADSQVRLVVERRYADILKKIREFKHSVDGIYFYKAFFYAKQQRNGSYDLEYRSAYAPDVKKYIPEIKITYPEGLKEYVNEILRTDLMQAQSRVFKNNHNHINLYFDHADISTPLGDESSLSLDCENSSVRYSINEHRSMYRHNPDYLIYDILYLQIPSDDISPDWLKLLEKHADILDGGVKFSVADAESERGILRLSEIECGNGISYAKLMK